MVVSYFADDSVYPRSGRRSKQRETYWANIAVNATTLRHVGGPDVEFVVFAGDHPSPGAAELLDAAGAEVRQVAFGHRPPLGFYHRYAGTFYVLDAMTALATEVAPGDVLLFVDPDIVWANPLGPLLAEVREGGIVAYELEVPDSVPLVDLTRRQQSDILVEMTGAGPARDQPALTHFGGEFYGMLGSELVTLLPAVEQLWEETLRRHERREPHHNLEEHVLNAAMWGRGEVSGRANALLQRVRTLPAPFGTRDRARSDLVLWHLPLEKDKGFLRVFRELADGRSMPPVGPTYQRWLGQRVGIRPTGGRWLADRARQAKWLLGGRSRVTNPTNYGL